GDGPDPDWHVVDADRAAGPRHGLDDRLPVERLQPAQVDDFQLDTVLGRPLRRLEAALHAGAPREQRRVTARAHDARVVSRAVRDRLELLPAPVTALRLEEDDRIL